MLLLGLPTEVLSLLLDTVCNQSLARLAVTCHKLHDIAGPDLFNRKLKATYGTIRLAASASRDADWSHPVELIEAIEAEPRISKFVEKIEFAPRSPYDEPDSFTEAIQSKLDARDYLATYIKEFEFLDESQKISWKAAIKQGDPDPAFIVLLSLCLEVTTLLLVDVGDLPRYLDPVIRHLRTAQSDRKTTMNGPAARFPEITKLEMEHGDTEGGVYLHQVPSVLLLPSLRKFKGWMVGDEDYDDAFIWPAGRKQACKIEKVALHLSHFTPHSLLEVIRGMPLLEKLVISDGHAWEVGHFEDENNVPSEWSSCNEYARYFRKYARSLLQERGLLMSIRDDKYTADTERIVIFKAPPGQEVDESLGLDLEDSSEPDEDDEEDDDT